MSAADIADNRWEREAAKPEITTASGLAQLSLVGVFSVFFVGVVLVSIYSIIAGPQESDLERRFREAQERQSQVEVTPGAPATPAPAAATPTPAAVPPPAAPAAE